MSLDHSLACEPPPPILSPSVTLLLPASGSSVHLPLAMCQRGWEVRPCGLALDRSPAWALAQSRLIPMWLCLGFLWVPLFPAGSEGVRNVPLVAPIPRIIFLLPLISL